MKYLLFLLLLLPILAHADSTICNLSPASTLTGTECVPIEQNGITVRTTPSGLISSVSTATVLAGTNATTALTLAQKFGYLADVKAYGATGNGTTDDCGGSNSIQTAFNNNPNGTIYFPPGTYKCTGPIKLTDTSGHNFQGDIIGNQATISFSNAGSSGDADSAMQHGFQAYPVTNGSGGDTTGMKNVRFINVNITGPTHGAGIYAANSENIIFENVESDANRYGIATETNINDQFINVGCQQFKNACLGWIYSGDTARVWYGSASVPLTTYWNDGMTVVGGIAASDVAGSAACIIDMGSQSESVRQIQGMACAGTIGGGGVQYGYLARNANPTINGGTWTENVNYPVAFLATNSGAGGSSTHITGITGAEPNGFITYGTFPDGFSYTARITNMWTVNAINDIDLSGITGGPSLIGQNVSEFMTGHHLISTQSGSQLIIDQGDSLITPSGTYKNLTFNQYFSLSSLASALSLGSSNAVAFNGLATVQNGTANLPGLSIRSANTGIYSAGSGDVDISSGGNQVFECNSSGCLIVGGLNVYGVGSVSLNAAASTNSFMTYTQNGVANWQTVNSGADNSWELVDVGSSKSDIYVTQGASPHMYEMKDGGDVSIGTNTPISGALLTVKGDIALPNGTTGAMLCLTSTGLMGHCTSTASCLTTCTCNCAAN